MLVEVVGEKELEMSATWLDFLKDFNVRCTLDKNQKEECCTPLRQEKAVGANHGPDFSLAFKCCASSALSYQYVT